MKACQKIKSWGRQVVHNFAYIWKKAVTYTSACIAVFQIVGFLCEFNDVFPQGLGFFTRLLISVMTVGGICVVLCIIVSLWMFRNKPIKVIDADNGHGVYVEYGDLLKDSDIQRNIVITANRCFDTIVDDDLISNKTIHGMAIKKICNSEFTEEMLANALEEDLEIRQRIKTYEVVKRKEKHKGRTKRYPVGTIAEFKKDTQDEEKYFFLGMSTFNSNLHAMTTDEEYIQALQSLILYCNQRAQGLPVYMPIIGTGGRNNKKREREILEFMIALFRFNRHLINTDMHIVVYHKRKDDVSIYGL